MATKKILLADVAELVQGLGKNFFNRKNFRLLVAYDGREALDVVKRERPDLAFINLKMTGISGDVCCRKIKGDPQLCSMPVVMVVSAGNEKDVELCHQAGCDEVIVTPISRRHRSFLNHRLLNDLLERTTERYETCLRIFYGQDSQDFCAAHTLNFGTGGVLIETQSPLPVETQVFLEIVLPCRPSSIRCRGRVAWLNYPRRSGSLPLSGEMGIQFLDLSSEDKDAIRSYIERENLSPI